jgi:hypothetical protein
MHIVTLTHRFPSQSCRVSWQVVDKIALNVCWVTIGLASKVNINQIGLVLCSKHHVCETDITVNPAKKMEVLDLFPNRKKKCFRRRKVHLFRLHINIGVAEDV